jgi:hypothetical protein
VEAARIVTENIVSHFGVASLGKEDYREVLNTMASGGWSGENNAARAGKKAVKRTTKKASAPRAESKCANIIGMIGRAKGTTLGEIMNAIQWQADLLQT